MGKKNKAEKNIDSEKQIQETTENKIDFYNGFSPSSDKNIPFPAPNKSEPRIYIEEEVFKEIQAHSTETTSVEICGVMIGEVRYDISGNYLYVCGSIRGENAKNSGVNVSFTPETWDYIHKIREEKYSNYSIVGWYHAHSGFGIFLSDMDKFIQDYFFNQPCSVALVVDPKASQCGIFAWQDGKIRPLKQCWVGKNTIPLAIGTVGGEETYRENSNSNNSNNSNVASDSSSNKDSQEEEESNDSFYKHAFYYFLCFNLAFLLANFLYLRNANDIASKTLHSEAREIIADWAMNQSISSDLHGLINGINEHLESLPASFTPKIENYKLFVQSVNLHLTNFAIKAKNQSDSAKATLRSIATRYTLDQLNAEDQMKVIKKMIAESILIQLDPYLVSLSAQPINEDRLKEANKMLNYILALYPEESRNIIKQKYYWIFQNN